MGKSTRKASLWRDVPAPRPYWRGRALTGLLLIVGLLAGCAGGSTPRTITATPPDGGTFVTATVAGADPVVSPATASTAAVPEIDAFITGLLDLYDIPGAGVTLVQNGAVRYVQGYGVRSTQTGAPVTPETQFAIGSITKSFTALGALQLVDQGQMQLDTPAITYYPGLQLADATATQNVTLRHLLAQTSGLPGNDDAAWYTGRVSTLAEAAAYAATLNLAAAPGAIHIYDNYNYALVGYLIEQVTGQTWADYTRAHVTAPLGMTGTTFDLTALQQSPDYAVPHHFEVLDGMQPQAFVSLAGIASAGALNVSAQGMGQYLLFQLGDGTFGGQTLLSGALLGEMHTLQASYSSQLPVGPTGFQTKGYALGWFVADFNGQQVIWHNGSIDGFYAIVLLIPSANVGVAVLSNAGLGTGSLFTLAAGLSLLEYAQGLQPGRDVVKALNVEAAFDPDDRQAKLDAARAYSADPADWSALLGTYSGSGGTVQIAQQGDGLVLVQGGASRTLIPYGPASFLTTNADRDGLVISYTVVVGDGGVLTLLRDSAVIGTKLAS